MYLFVSLCETPCLCTYWCPDDYGWDSSDLINTPFRSPSVTLFYFHLMMSPDGPYYTTAPTQFEVSNAFTICWVILHDGSTQWRHEAFSSQGDMFPIVIAIRLCSPGSDPAAVPWDAVPLSLHTASAPSHHDRLGVRQRAVPYLHWLVIQYLNIV